MMSRGQLLYVILLPLLAPLAAEDPEERMIAEMMEHGVASTSGFLLPPSQPHRDLTHPALLLELLRSGALRPLRPAEDKDANDSQDASISDNQDHSNIDHPSSSSSSEDTKDDDAADDEEEKQKEDQAVADDRQELEEVVSKRVFCNTFTGCGGKHRDRSRRRQGLERLGKRLIPLLVKRPFCNSFGCYNGKRAAAGQQGAAATGLVGLPLMHAVPVSDLSPALRARLLTVVDGPSEASLVGKRLFCNGYGGCRGGKRSLFAPWLPKMNGVASGRR